MQLLDLRGQVSSVDRYLRSGATFLDSETWLVLQGLSPPLLASGSSSFAENITCHPAKITVMGQSSEKLL
jgi:hypothetical protein